MDILDLVQQLLAMAGVSAAIVMLVNLLAYLGLIPTGQEKGVKKQVNLVLQLLALVGLWAVKTFTDLDLALVDDYAQRVADLGVAIIALIPLVLNLSPKAHDVLAEAKVPVVGFSQSNGDETLVESLSK